jgi:putative DNA primase/helicase
MEERGLRAQLYSWLEHAEYDRETRAGVIVVPWAPTRAKVANVIDALHAATHLAATVDPPAWLDTGGTDQPNDVVAVANGLLNVRTRELRPHTPAFFAHHSLPFAYNPETAPPDRWRQFLDELWPKDEQSIETLAEAMGYILGGDTAQQKMFLAVGPKRSGKGTIARVLTGLFGVHNVAAPTLSSLTANFGLAPLIGKPLAIISDARLSTRADNMIAVERLLSISGEDSLTVDRKFQSAWTGRLPTRFLILSNELPRFADASGALASRFVLLVLTKSFYGREDPALTTELLEEAPGIFNWALDGLDRLLERGYFLQPDSAKEALQHFEDLGSPVGAFVRDICLVGPAFETDSDLLFDEWKTWCAEEGRTHPGTKAVFVRDLRAAVPGITPSRPRRSGHRAHTLNGIAIRSELPGGPLTIPDQPRPEDDGQGWSGVEVTPASNGAEPGDQIAQLDFDALRRP